MTTTALRDFQQEILTKWGSSPCRRTLVAANCGAGKTVIGGAMVREIARAGKRALFCFDLKCLPLQAAHDIQKLGVSVGIFAAGFPKPSGAESVTMVMLQTLEALLRKNPDGLTDCFGAIDLLIFDEVHDLVKRKGFSALRDAYPDARQVGLTATPYRLSPQEYLGRWFDSVIEAPQPSDLIRKGFILPERVFVPKIVIDDSKLDTDSEGEFSAASQEKQVLRQTSIDSVVTAWQKICPGIPTACYAASVPHAKALATAFNRFFEGNRGLYPNANAAWQTGETPKAERDAQFASMRRGQTLVICSVGTLTKGFDLDCIGAILFVRSTNSRALYMQSAGRGARTLKQAHSSFPEGKKWYYLLVFSSAVDKFGSPSDYQNYDISERGAKPSIVPRKPCPECGHQCLASAKRCEYCGYLFELPAGPALEETEFETVDLQEHLTAEGRRKVRLARRARLEAMVTGVHLPDTIAGAENMPESWYRGLIFGPNPTEDDRITFMDYLEDTGMSATSKAIEMQREFGDVA